SSEGAAVGSTLERRSSAHLAADCKAIRRVVFFGQRGERSWRRRRSRTRRSGFFGETDRRNRQDRGSRRPWDSCAAAPRPAARRRVDRAHLRALLDFVSPHDAPPRGGGICVVRVVHSLFASTDDWDNQLEGTESGWPGFFRILRIYTHA